MTAGGHVLRDRDGVHGDEVRPAVRLVESADPAAVFDSLAGSCVPAVCDSCTINLSRGLHGSLCFVHPPRATTVGGILRIANRADATSMHRVQVPFAHPDGASCGTRDAAPGDEFSGVATFMWHFRAPTCVERSMVATLVEHAVRTVMWQRSEVAAGLASARADNLQVALQASRRLGAAIGIVMCKTNLAEDEVFRLLQVTSRHRNLELHDLAQEVLDTGWLDPALIPARADAT